MQGVLRDVYENSDGVFCAGVHLVCDDVAIQSHQLQLQYHLQMYKLNAEVCRKRWSQNSGTHLRERLLLFVVLVFVLAAVTVAVPPPLPPFLLALLLPLTLPSSSLPLPSSPSPPVAPHSTCIYTYIYIYITEVLSHICVFGLIECF